MTIIRFTDVSLSFGDHNLFDKVSFSIEAGERVCIVGRNGTGKSTILKVLEGLQDIDAGSIVQDQGLLIKRLQQEPPQQLEISVYEYLAQSFGEALPGLMAYKQAIETGSLSIDLEGDHEHHYWEMDAAIHKVATKLNIPLEKKLSEFSGGWLRRIELGRALVSNPSVLLLDEPTNHLDISSIRWLEAELANYQGTIIFISHDRAFVNKMATRILELDRGQIYSHPGSFEQYLSLRDKRLEDEKTQVALFEKNLAKEEVWIRKGIEARRTRNEGRVRALKAMRREHAALRKIDSYGNISFQQTSKSGKLVFDIKDVSLKLGENLIFDKFSTKVTAGTKIALVGDNGAGKTSLIKLLLGELQPTTGTIHIGTNLQTAYFDQLRVALEPEKTAIDNIFDGKVEAMVHGSVRHAIGYLQDFLFPPEKARGKVSTFSGGEKNRLLLAKLLAKESNLLILDEPTNDLDIETLELLEELVSNYQGTVIVVSHDRSFIDNIAVETWFIEDQRVWLYVGGYSDNIATHENLVLKHQEQVASALAKQAAKDLAATPTQELSSEQKSPTNPSSNSANNSGAENTRVQMRSLKLSFKEQQDLKNLPDQIKALEAEIEQLNGEISDPANSSDFILLDKLSTELNAKNELLEELTIRLWELEEKVEKINEQKSKR